MNTYLFFALIILVAIILVYFISYWYDHGELPHAPFADAMERMKDSMNQTYDNYFSSAEHLYEQTTGHINDEAAQMALSKAEQKERMYSRQEGMGRISDRNLADAAATAFMVADLERFNVAPSAKDPQQANMAQNRAALAYAAAMRRVAANPVRAVQGAGENAHVPPAEFMIDRVEDFYEDYVARMTLDPEALQQFGLPNLEQLRNNVREARVEVAATNANTGKKSKRRRRKKNVKLTEKQNMQDQYFEERDIRNDPQNVHETQVNKDMSRIYRNIMHKNQFEDTLFDYEQTGVNPATLKEIRQYAKSYQFPDKKKRKRALQTIDKMAEGNWISTLNARENEVLVNVWKRIASPENEKHRDGLHSALMDSLADCVEEGYNGQDYQVCASGRTGRVLGSLTLLDADEKISEPIKTTEVLRNEVFAKSYQIIQNALKETDTETARAYNGALESPAPDVEQRVTEFENDLRNRIANTLRSDYNDKVDDKVLGNLIADAQAGV